MTWGTQYFVVLSEPSADWSNPPDELTTRHIEFLLELEATGVTVMSGPTGIDEGGWHGAGLTIVRAASLDEAAATMARDPYVTAGVQTQTVTAWHVTSGKIQLDAQLSNASIAIA